MLSSNRSVIRSVFNSCSVEKERRNFQRRFVRIICNDRQIRILEEKYRSWQFLILSSSSFLFEKRKSKFEIGHFF